MLRIATIESPECFLTSDSQYDFLHLTTAESFLSEMILANVPDTTVLNIKLRESVELGGVNDEEGIRMSNITQIFKANNISYFLLNHRSSPYIERWARRNNFILLRTPWETQRKFENKLFFDRFLKANNIPSPQSYILESATDIENIKKFPVIMQYPFTDHSSHTSYARSAAELGRKIRKLALPYPLLCREYIQGTPLGVSILIGKTKVIFSALRLQCFSAEKPLFSEFLGIHWLPSQSISPLAEKNINTLLRNLSDCLQQKGFVGVANFDLVLHDDVPYVLECNPRMSSATPCFALWPGLVHGINFCDEFIRVLTGTDLSVNIPHVPKTNFEGSYIEFGYLAERFQKMKQKRDKKIDFMPKSGFYKWEKSGICFDTTDRKAFRDENCFLFHSTVSPRALIKNTKILGVLFSHFPIVECENNRSKFSQKGAAIIDYLEKQIILK